MGGMDQLFISIHHLLIDVWWFVLVITGLQQIIEVPKGLGFMASILVFGQIGGG
jgi:hypothetical protein